MSATEERSFGLGRMVDFLSAGVFEDVSTHADWQSLIGQPLEEVQNLENETIIRIAGKQIFIVNAKVDRETLYIDGMIDNLVVFFSSEARNDFFAQYPDIAAE